MNSQLPHPTCLTITCTDSAGGSSAPLDLAVFAQQGCIGTSVITAVMSRSTCEITAIAEVPEEVVIAQLDTVLPDIGATAVKTGVLGTAAIVQNTADRLEAWGYKHLVVDTVMTGTGKVALLHPEAVAALRTDLLPLASVVTMTREEMETISGRKIASPAHRHEAFKRLSTIGPARFIVFDDDQARLTIWGGDSAEEVATPTLMLESGYGHRDAFSALLTAMLASTTPIDTAILDAVTATQAMVTAAAAAGQGEPILRAGSTR